MNPSKNKEYYKQLLIDTADQAAELLATGKTIEIDRSRSGIKMYSYRRRHEVINRQKKNEVEG